MGEWEENLESKSVGWLGEIARLANYIAMDAFAIASERGAQ